MNQMTKEEYEKHQENKNIILNVGGKSFTCDCGCNVFHHPGWDKDEYRCNSCSATYRKGVN